MKITTSFITAIFLISLVSAQAQVTDLIETKPLEDFVAGQPVITEFQFNYPPKSFSYPHQIFHPPLIFKIEISSNNSDYPVQKNEFNINGDITIKTSSEPDKKYFFFCDEDNFMLHHPTAFVEINNIPNGTFYCSSNLLSLELDSENYVTMQINSNPALWPGTYNFSIGLYHPELPTNQSNLTIYSPEEIIYNTRRINFNITTTSISTIEYLDNNDRYPRWRTLCRNCDEYGFLRRRLKTFQDGIQNITIRATNYVDEQEEKNITFFIDSRNPRLSSPTPRRNHFSNGTFQLSFIETNPKNLTLFYANNSKEINLSNCYQDRTKTICNIFANLTKYEEQEIEYFFNLEDIAGNIDESRATQIKVDTTPPTLNNPDFVENNDNRFEFYLNITEKNFDKATINYLDSRGRERERRLCSRLRNGICERRITLRGDYDFELRITDEAGNAVSFPI